MGILDSVYAIVDGVPISLNQSRVHTFLRCHRKYGWFHIENITPDRPAYHFSLGKAVHSAIAHVSGGTLSEAEAIKLAEKEFLSEMPVKRGIGDDEVIAENMDLIQSMLPAYFDHYRDDKDPWTPLSIEAKGKVEVGTNTNVFLVFRTDELALWHRMLWIVDHKTAKKLDPRDLLKWEMDIQISAYTYGVSKLLGRRIAGAIINMLVKTKVPQFHREFFTRTDEELAEFEREFVEIAREIKTRHQRVQEGEDWKTVFYKNTQECFTYGTCWFRDLCLKDTEIRRMSFKTRDPDYVDDPRLLEEKSLP